MDILPGHQSVVQFVVDDEVGPLVPLRTARSLTARGYLFVCS